MKFGKLLKYLSLVKLVVVQIHMISVQGKELQSRDSVQKETHLNCWFGLECL